MHILLIVLLLNLVGGTMGKDDSKKGAGLMIQKLPAESAEVLRYLPRNVVIAHRGTTYWAPEETEAAIRWARNIGADYLELDLQRTKDGVLIALHDINLRRTTNVEDVFPQRADAPVSEFTLGELRRLDAGSWFNQEHPSRARKSFAGLDILTLEDVVRIAEGCRIARDEQGHRLYEIGPGGGERTRYEPDPIDNGNRPGIYPETKEPQLFPGMEEDLRKELERLGWYHPDVTKMKKIAVQPRLVDIADTPARVILQTFSDESLAKLKEAFSRRIPTCFLLWQGTELSDLRDDTPEAYAAKINYGIEHGAMIMGPSIAGAPNEYDDLLAEWQGNMIYRGGMAIHPYTFDTEEQMAEYTGWQSQNPYSGRVDGMFTNKADMTIRFYQQVLRPEYLKPNAALHMPDNIQQRKKLREAEGVLDALGYKR